MNERGIVRICVNNFAHAAAGYLVVHHDVLLQLLANVVELVRTSELYQPFEKARLGVKRASLQLAKYAEQLETMFVADTDCHRHGHDTTQYRGPE